MSLQRTKRLALVAGWLLCIESLASAALFIAPTYDNSTSTGRKPNGTSAHTTHRSVQLILASELGTMPLATLIKRVGFEMNTSTTSTGTAKLYLQNTTDTTYNKGTDWATAITGMTLVYADGPYNLSVSSNTIDLTLTTPFAYTGGGIYLAMDYVGTTFSANVAVYRCNSGGLSPGCATNSSATATPPTLLGTTAFRPDVRWGWDGTQGEACMSGSDCVGQTCVDGRCCNSACGGGSTTDCVVCSVAAGAAQNGVCANLPNATTCSDGSACTQADACSAGTCVGSNPVVCAMPDQCHSAGACDPATGVCSNPPVVNGTGCNDGNACTQTDQCQSGCAKEATRSPVRPPTSAMSASATPSRAAAGRPTWWTAPRATAPVGTLA